MRLSTSDTSRREIAKSALDASVVNLSTRLGKRARKSGFPIGPRAQFGARSLLATPKGAGAQIGPRHHGGAL